MLTYILLWVTAPACFLHSQSCLPHNTSTPNALPTASSFMVMFVTKLKALPSHHGGTAYEQGHDWSHHVKMEKTPPALTAPWVSLPLHYLAQEYAEWWWPWRQGLQLPPLLLVPSAESFNVSTVHGPPCRLEWYIVRSMQSLHVYM